MSSSFTPYKGLELQATGENAGTWGQVVNDGVISVLDNNVGGVTTKSLTNLDVTLTDAEAENACLRLAGVLTGDVTVFNACQGFYYLENLTTGNFDVTLTNGTNFVILPQGMRGIVFADTANGIRAFSLLSSDGTEDFPLGTTMLFIQSAVPTGWTLVSTWNDYGLKLSATTGGATVAGIAYSTVFGLTATDAHTLTLSEIPSHQHQYTATARTTKSGVAAHADYNGHTNTIGTPTATWSTVGGGGSHAHAIDMRLRHVTTVVGERTA